MNSRHGTFIILLLVAGSKVAAHDSVPASVRELRFAVEPHPAFKPNPEALPNADELAAAVAQSTTRCRAESLEKRISQATPPEASNGTGRKAAAKEYQNSLGMTMIHIEPGEFVMGSDQGDWDEVPEHSVRISRPFYVGATEVTNVQYEQFDPDHRKLRDKLGFSKLDDEAVVFVSWHDAVRFCQWLSKKEGRPYRLPTEAEWEYACRAGTTTAFYTGEVLPEPFHNNALRDSWHGGWYPSPRWSAGTWYPSPEEARARSVVPLTVAETAPNSWGLFDMHGNVEEWCSDWYGPYPSQPQLDPLGPAGGNFRVSRGGSHSSELKYLRSANRLGTLPVDNHWLIGFRVVQGALHQVPAEQKRVSQQDAAEVQSVRATATTSAANTSSPAAPYFDGPRLFVKVPPGSDGPLFSRHNHAPAIVDCPNGDLLAIWYTCRDEPGRELAIASSRLRPHRTEWDAAEPFWDAPDRNDHTLRLWRDEQGKLYHFNGLSAAGTWGSLAVVMRTSTDSGHTWSNARLIRPEHHQGVGSLMRLKSGTVLMVGEAATRFGDAGYLWESHDDCRTWKSHRPQKDPPQSFAPEVRGPWIAGTHITVLELNDGRLLALARAGNISGRMPQSMSTDGGRTWTYEASPFDPIGGRQRPVLLRLREGPILFASFAKTLPATGGDGKAFEYSGLFAALSYDEGKTWKTKKPITVAGAAREVEGIGKRSPVSISPRQGEPTGYLAVCQSADGLIHLVTSRNHYAFNQAWLEATSERGRPLSGK